jgi:hypothetical protein
MLLFTIHLKDQRAIAPGAPTGGCDAPHPASIAVQIINADRALLLPPNNNKPIPCRSFAPLIAYVLSAFLHVRRAAAATATRADVIRIIVAARAATATSVVAATTTAAAPLSTI